jgi:hypothetical protein
MDNMTGLTEADILSDVIAPDEPTMNRDFALAILSLRFNQGATSRIGDLLQKKNRGSISPQEAAVLEKYLRVGQFLDLMQAKARLSLQTPPAAAK